MLRVKSTVRASSSVRASESSEDGAAGARPRLGDASNRVSRLVKPSMIQWGGASLADDSTAAVVAAAVAAQKEAERRAIEEKMADLLATKAYLIGNSDRTNELFRDKTFHSTVKPNSLEEEIDENDADETELTTQHGEMMRSKLIDEFQLLSSVDEYGNTEAPRIQTSEISNDEMRRDLLGHSGKSLVKFVVYGDATHERPVLDKQFNRIAIRAAKCPSFALYSGWFVHSTAFQWLILVLILINVLCVGIQTEFNMYELYLTPDDGTPNTIALECVNLFCLVFFIVEIVLKMTFNPTIFWHNGWDIFDFVVTAVSLIPELFDLAGPETFDRGHKVRQMECQSSQSWKQSGVCYQDAWYVQVLDFLRVFRVFRCLKAVARFRQIRLVVLALFKTFKTLLTILLLLTIFWLIFSVSGVILFRTRLQENTKKRELRPSNPKDPDFKMGDLEYSDAFQTWHRSCLTLFVIFTNDHWYEMVKDLMVVNPIMGPLFIIAWVLIAAFIFQNIVLGFLNNNFAEIRETIGKNIDEMERLETLMQAVTELKKMGKEDAEADEKEKTEEEQRSKSKSKSALEGGSGRVTEADWRSGRVAQLQIPGFQPNLNQSANAGPQPQIKDNELPAVKMIPEKTKKGPNKKGAEEGKNNNSSRNWNERERRSRSEGQSWLKSVDGGGGGGVDGEREAPPVDRERDWERYVVTNLMEMEDTNKETIWPRDTLFDFYCLMEALQENLGERAYILQLIKTSMIDMADRKGDNEDQFIKAVNEPDPGGAEQFQFLVNSDHFNKQIEHIVGHKEARYIRQMIKAIMTEDHL